MYRSNVKDFRLECFCFLPGVPKKLFHELSTEPSLSRFGALNAKFQSVAAFSGHLVLSCISKIIHTCFVRIILLENPDNTCGIFPIVITSLQVHFRLTGWLLTLKKSVII